MRLMRGVYVVMVRMNLVVDRRALVHRRLRVGQAVRADRRYLQRTRVGDVMVLRVVRWRRMVRSVSIRGVRKLKLISGRRRSRRVWEEPIVL